MMKKFASRLALMLGLALPLAALADAPAEVSMAAMHAGLVSETTTVHIAQLHMQHILNCLAGPGNPGFDKTVPNPCKGLGSGAIPDTSDPVKRKVLEDSAHKAAEALKKNDLGSIKKDAAAISSALNSVK
jgi:hypothetical protein